MDSQVIRAECRFLLARIDRMELEARSFRSNIAQQIRILDIIWMTLATTDALDFLHLRNEMRRLDVLDATMAVFLAMLNTQRDIIWSLM